MKWSEEEIKLLTENYPVKTIDELLLLFPNRNKSSITNKAQKLGLKKINPEKFMNKNLWSKEEINLLITNYKTKNNDELQKLFPNRTLKSIHDKAEDLHLKKREIIKTKFKWTEENTKFLIEHYADYTNNELIDMYFHGLKRKELTNKAWKLGLKKNELALEKINKIRAEKASEIHKGKIVSEETRKKMSKIKKKQYREGIIIHHWVGRIVSEEEKERSRQRVKGRWSGDKNPRHINPLFGSDNGRWNGGITNLSQALRENIYDWKQDSMKMCDYKCLFTMCNFDNIHHLYPFNFMIKETLEELNLDSKENLGDYSLEEQELIKEIINRKHKEHGLGVCLCNEIHKLYHDNYGYIEFDVDSFKQFTKEYFEGKYDDLLEDKFKSINNSSNYDYVVNKINEMIKIDS